MSLARHAQITQVNLQYLRAILKKKSGLKLGTHCTGWFKYYAYNLLHIECPPTIDPFPLTILNPYQAFFSFD